MVTNNSINSNIPIELSKGGTNATSMATNTGVVKYDGTRLITSSTALIDSSNRYSNTSQPAFLATSSGSTANVTGDGTAFTCIFDSEIYDQNSNFNNGTYTFTAPVTGRYLFCATIIIGNIGAGHTTCGLNLVATSRTISLTDISPAAIKDSSSNCQVNGSTFVDMAAGNTAYLSLTVYNSTKTITYGAGSFFSGALIC